MATAAFRPFPCVFAEFDTAIESREEGRDLVMHGRDPRDRAGSAAFSGIRRATG
jgi:hypothetical protein